MTMPFKMDNVRKGDDNLLKEARKKKNMTQQELADKVGVSRQQISNVENGRNELSVDLAKKIAVVLEIEWHLLF